MSQLVNDAVDAVLQMWLDKPSNGSAIEKVNVEARNRSKAQLRSQWPGMYNALKSLALAKAYSNTNPESVAIATCGDCEKEWILIEGEGTACSNCETAKRVGVRIVRRVR